MEEFVLEMLQLQFKTQGEISFEIDKSIYNPDTNTTVTKCSYILLEDIGIIYYDPIRKESFYNGTIPGSYFFGIMHFRLKRDFKPILPVIVESFLIDAYHQNIPQKLIFSEQLEKELFKW